ncbi:MAG: hypothetical protein V1853_02240 [bacterium]
MERESAPDINPEKIEQPFVGDNLEMKSKEDRERTENIRGRSKLNQVFRRVLSRTFIKLERMWYEEEDLETLRQLEGVTERSASLAKAAGEYYRILFQKAQRQPEQTYEHKGRDDEAAGYMKDMATRLRRLREKMPRQEFVTRLQAVLHESDEEYATEINEEQIDDGTYESRGERLKQSEGDNVIEEGVENFKFNQGNIAESTLMIRNPQTGMRLDLGQLLPDQRNMAPGRLVDYQAELDKNTNEIVHKPIPVSLKEQTSMRKDDKFAYYPGTRKVVYGDLSEKGGMLSLLHEISHSWQSVYLPDKPGRYDFRQFYSKIKVELTVHERFEKDFREGRMSSDEISWYRDFFIEELGQLGVEVNLNHLYGEGVELQEGEFRIKDDLSNREFIIRSEKLSELVNEYAAEERDAWAHALRVMRFLRKQGFDIAPDIKTLDDVRQVVDSALQTYQDSIDRDMESVNSKTRFTRLPRRKESREE